MKLIKILFITATIFALVPSSKGQELLLGDIEMRRSGTKTDIFRAYKKGAIKPFSGTVVDTEGFTIAKFKYQNGLIHRTIKKSFDKKLLEESQYENGRRNGFYHQFDENGKKKIVGFFKNDYKDGEWDFYYSNGIVKEKGHFINDKKAGKWIRYLENENIEREDSFSNEGVLLFGSFYKDGKFSSIVTPLSKINPVDENGTKFFYDQLGMKFSGIIREEFQDSIGQYFTKESQIVSGLPRGMWKVYFDNSNIKEQGNLGMDGKAEGDFIEYYKSGKLKTQGSFKSGYKNGSWNLFEEDGSYVIGTYIDDMRQSVWRYFNNKGKVIKEELYIHGEIQR